MNQKFYKCSFVYIEKKWFKAACLCMAKIELMDYGDLWCHGTHPVGERGFGGNRI